MPSGSSGASMVARDMMGRMASNVSTTRRPGCSRWYSASSSSHSAPRPRQAQVLVCRAAARRRAGALHLAVCEGRMASSVDGYVQAQALMLVLCPCLLPLCAAPCQPLAVQEACTPATRDRDNGFIPCISQARLTRGWPSLDCRRLQKQLSSEQRKPLDFHFMESKWCGSGSD